MSFSLVISWWIFPAAVTVTGLFWALFIVKGDGYLAGLDNLFALAVVAIVSAVVWAVAGFLK